MANIATYLQKILDAIYGEEVRSSIHDALIAMNTESSRAIEFASTAKDSATSAASSAKSSASTATEKAKQAADSASAAKTSEEKAKVSETNAVNKATEAAEAATRSKASETAAANSEAAAKQKAVEAETARTRAETAWNNAVESASAAAKSAKTAQQYSGNPPKIQNGSWWIWDAAVGDYVDTHMTSEIPGPTGVGIMDISLISGDHSPGTSDVYTIKMTDGSHYTISVYNGRNGEGTGDMLGISFDLVIPRNGWIDGEATVADERLLALATHKYFVDADESCKNEYDDCHVRAKNIVQNGYITFLSDIDPEIDITVNILRLELSANSRGV